MSKRLFLSGIAAAGLAVALAAPVLSSPASNIISGPILARGDFGGRVDVKFKLETAHGIHVANVDDAGEVAMQRLEIGPGGTTGWHSHPGPAVAIIQAGHLTLVSQQDGVCESVTYGPGQSFVDAGQGNVHLARNPSSSANTVVFVTYFDVGTAGPRIDVPDPGIC